MRPTRLTPHRLSLRPLLVCLSLPVFLVVAVAADKRPSLDDFLKQAGYSRLELKSGQRDHLLVLGKANGKKVVCMVDTGCPGNLIDSERAPRLRETGVRDEPIYGIVGKVVERLRLGELDHLELGSFKYTNLPVVLAAINKRPDEGQWIERVDLILGLDYLNRVSALISYRSPCLYFRKEPPSPKVADIVRKSLLASGFSAIPLHGRKDDVLVVDVTVNGKPARLVLDTGASSTLLDREQLGAYGLTEHKQIGELQDVSSRRVFLGATRISLKIGEVELKSLPVGTASLPTFARFNAELRKAGKSEVLGFLGPEFLCMTSAIIDSTAECMYLLQPSK